MEHEYRVTSDWPPFGKRDSKKAMRRLPGGRVFFGVMKESRTRQYESHIKAEAQRVYRLNPTITPVKIWLLVKMEPPKSMSAKKKALALTGGISPTRKPDCSNVLKSWEDGFKGVFYRDDAQIVQVNVRKVYAESEGVEAIVQFSDDAFPPPLPSRNGRSSRR